MRAVVARIAPTCCDLHFVERRVAHVARSVDASSGHFEDRRTKEFYRHLTLRTFSRRRLCQQSFFFFSRGGLHVLLFQFTLNVFSHVIVVEEKKNHWRFVEERVIFMRAQNLQRVACSRISSR